jgi:hypothetical protein
MTRNKSSNSRKGFDELRKQIDADPARRANVEEHKTAAYLHDRDLQSQVWFVKGRQEFERGEFVER